jgi:hypothetical protein
MATDVQLRCNAKDGRESQPDDPTDGGSSGFFRGLDFLL